MMNPRFYKKTAGILREVPENSIEEDKIAEVRMSGADFFDMRTRMYRAENDVRWMSNKISDLEEVSKKFAAQNTELKNYVSKAKVALQNMQEELIFKESDLEEVKEALAVSENRNANFIRIAKQKANKDHGAPRKADGYVVIASRQVKQVCGREGNDRYEVVAWKTTFQSPYKADMEPLNTVEDLILEDLFEKHLILPSMGCVLMNTKLQNGEFESFFEDIGTNAAYAWQFIRNIKSGYYEIDVFTKSELRIPKERMLA